MAERQRCRASTILGVTDPYVAFCVDRATLTLIGEIETAQEAAEKRLPKNAKDAAHVRARQRVLDQYLGVELADAPGRFRSPNAR